jgi:drug/metabolite transporter (DMT)-like permease
MLGNFITAIIGLPFIVSSQLPPLPSWMMLALLGTVQLGFSYVLYTIAIKRVTAMEATLIPLLEPILNPLWVMLLVGEWPGPWASVGGALVIGAVLVRGMVMLRRPSAPAAA